MSIISFLFGIKCVGLLLRAVREGIFAIFRKTVFGRTSVAVQETRRMYRLAVLEVTAPLGTLSNFPPINQEKDTGEIYAVTITLLNTNADHPNPPPSRTGQSGASAEEAKGDVEPNADTRTGQS